MSTLPPCLSWHHKLLSYTGTHDALRSHVEHFIQLAEEDSMVNESLEGKTNAAVASAFHSFGNVCKQVQ